MQKGDPVEIRFPDGTVEAGRIADLDAATVVIARPTPDASIIVARRRLEPAGARGWRLVL